MENGKRIIGEDWIWEDEHPAYKELSDDLDRRLKLDRLRFLMEEIKEES